ncbi:hypothetical protein DUZ99_06850 [Xylanibacillus composti]|uniref:Uncharacterized protein n=1 Tax=Xylanibacillus composti TaxID=1572762 RepID=A0A8J4H657_9BACL|nr:hypothetical protein [Xylanibacillus composti]GIQ70317.1 hypothetical protein XYCOK13_31410 [Xylanibacillus composti]
MLPNIRINSFADQNTEEEERTAPPAETAAHKMYAAVFFVCTLCYNKITSLVSAYRNETMLQLDKSSEGI